MLHAESCQIVQCALGGREGGERREGEGREGGERREGEGGRGGKELALVRDDSTLIIGVKLSMDLQ